MKTLDVQENISIKIEQAKECEKKSLQLCTQYVHVNNPKFLKQMGGYLGTYANNLRSALNYAMADYATQKGITVNTDFPYNSTKDNFDKIKLVLLISKSDPSLYSFIESLQSYNENTWLDTIMKLSNMDKHKLLVDVQNFDIAQFVGWNEKGKIEPPLIRNGEVIIISPDGRSILSKRAPCYVEQVRLFALPNGKWINFMIPIENYFIEFIPFVTRTSKMVENTLDKFYKLWD